MKNVGKISPVCPAVPFNGPDGDDHRLLAGCGALRHEVSINVRHQTVFTSKQYRFQRPRRNKKQLSATVRTSKGISGTWGDW